MYSASSSSIVNDVSQSQASPRASAAPAGAESGPSVAPSAPASGPAAPFAITPSRLRLALLVLIGVYPLITGLSYGVGIFTGSWQIWQRGLVLTPLMVTAMVFGLIPFIQFRFGRFIATGRW